MTWSNRRGLTRFQARTYMDFGNVVLPWTRHVRAGRDLLRRAFEAANKIGDLTYAAYSGNQLNTNLLAAGDPLVEVQREAEHGLAFAQKARFGFVIDIIATQLGLIRTLRGLTPKFGSFDDAQFDELRIERRFAGNPDLALAECWYWIRKLQARFFAGDYAAAIEASSRAQPLLWTSPSYFETAEYHFYGALSRAASCDSAAAGEQPAASGGSGRASQAARGLGGELPGEFREPRRAGRRRDRPPRRPRARCRAPLRTGHPLGPRQRLCPQRGARQRTGRALLRGAWLREDRPCVSAERPLLLSALGSRWQGAATRSAISAPRARKSQHPGRRARSGRRSNTWTSRP